MNESFLRCTPSVFVINNEYEVLAWARTNGIFSIKIGEQIFYEDNSGVLSSEKSYARIRVPQEILNEQKSYEVVFRETINRKAYYSELLPAQSFVFSFKPLLKTENIHIYHIADVHYHFDVACKTASYFGDATDLFIVNGDIGEVETEENYFEIAKFVGDISKGEIPVVFTRGNHDTRGRLAEKYTDIFPCNGKETFYTFELGCLIGIVLDCGEDKRDDHLDYNSMEASNAKSPEVYGGVNVFSAYRQRELSFLKKVGRFDTQKIPFAISHICPVMTTYTKGDVFDIERECYGNWNIELERMGVRFMLCGHAHKVHIVQSDSMLNTLSHNYPVIIGSATFGEEDIWGAALIVNQNCIQVLFTDKNKEIKEKFVLTLDGVTNAV